MCTKPPKIKNTPPPPPVKAPEIELGNEATVSDERRRAARGRNALRTGLNVPSSGGSGLAIPQ